MRTITKALLAVLTILLITGLAALFLLQRQAGRQRPSANSWLTQPVAQAEQPSPQTAPLAQLEIDTEELTRLRHQESELIRLRGQVGSLRRQLEEEKNLSQRLEADLKLARDQTNALSVDRYVSSDAWEDVGQLSPAAALQTALWAAKSKNDDRFAEIFGQTPDQKARRRATRTLKGADLGPWEGARGATVISTLKDLNGSMLYVVKFDSATEDRFPWDFPWNFHLIHGEQGWQIDSLDQTRPK